MENPAITQFNACNCPTDKTQVEKCYNNDPRWVKVTVPYAQSAILFAKGTLRVICNTDACEDACPPQIERPTGSPSVPTVVLQGEALYEQEWNTGAALRSQAIALTPAAATVDGLEYDDFDDLCTAITNLVADCSCDCD